MIYVIECESSKWYVGRTTQDAERRFAEHVEGKKASEWTKTYRPLRLASVEKMKTKFDEDVKVLELMTRFGMDNVRGGSYCQMILSEAQRKVFHSQQATASNTCFLCHSPSHFFANCPFKAGACFICKKTGHRAKDCY